jgi:hypothetical protein
MLRVDVKLLSCFLVIHWTPAGSREESVLLAKVALGPGYIVIIRKASGSHIWNCPHQPSQGNKSKPYHISGGMSKTSVILISLYDVDVVEPIIPCLIHQSSPWKPQNYIQGWEWWLQTQPNSSLNAAATPDVFSLNRLARSRVRGVQPLIWRRYSFLSLMKKGTKRSHIVEDQTILYMSSLAQSCCVNSLVLFYDISWRDLDWLHVPKVSHWSALWVTLINWTGWSG